PVFVVVADGVPDIEYGGPVVQDRLLFGGGHAQAGGARDLAVVRLGAAIEQAQQRRLAGAVAADQADALAGLDGEVGVVEQRVVAVGQLDAGEGNEGCQSHEKKLPDAEQPVLSQEACRPPAVLKWAGKTGRAIAAGANPSRKVRTPQGRIAANGRPAAPR